MKSPLAIIFAVFCGVYFLAPAAGLKAVSKRGIPWFGDGFQTFNSPVLGGFAKLGGGGGGAVGPWAYQPRPIGPSPAEVSNTIAAAKQASANVLIAQQQVQAAKENVLNQQRMAMDKETAATLLTQKSEAAAAIQRSEAAAAAQSVVLAQQRLAAAKNAVAHQQRIASAKEAEAAAALQRSAHAAAAEIQRTEYEATKYANLHRTGSAAAAHHLSATKDAALAPLTSGTNHVPGLETVHGWSGFLGGGGGLPPTGPWSSSVSPKFSLGPFNQPW